MSDENVANIMEARGIIKVFGGLAQKAGLQMAAVERYNRPDQSVTGQVLKLTDYTADFGALSNALGRLGQRGATNDGGQLIEGIYESAREQIKREARRPVIVALTVGGVEQSTRDSKQVLDELQKAGAMLYVVETSGVTQRAA